MPGRAEDIVKETTDKSLNDNMKLRAEKKARSAGACTVEPAHVETAKDEAAHDLPPGPSAEVKPLHWQAAALARLMQIPKGSVRDLSRKRIEAFARANGRMEIDLDTTEAGLAANSTVSKCPFAATSAASSEATPEPVPRHAVPAWTDAARSELQAVPEGHYRDMMVTAAETIAGQKSLAKIDRAFMQTILGTFAAGSKSVATSLPWSDSARARIDKAPALVRGMLQKEIEGWAKRNDMSHVTEAAVEGVRRQWIERGVFHLDPDDPRNNS